jgi:hypothetical protein
MEALMATGKSGRLVIEIDPQIKRRLHGALAMEGTTLKAWFVSAASAYLEAQEQPSSSIRKNKAKKDTP